MSEQSNQSNSTNDQSDSWFSFESITSYFSGSTTKDEEPIEKQDEKYSDVNGTSTYKLVGKSLEKDPDNYQYFVLPEDLSSKKVVDIVGSGYNSDMTKYTIFFEDSEYKLELIAYGDCCSFSWFENFDGCEFCYDLMGKKIEKVGFHGDTEVDLPHTGRDDGEINHECTVKFVDGERDYKFILRNSSNGYYDGWLETRVSQK